MDQDKVKPYEDLVNAIILRAVFDYRKTKDVLEREKIRCFFLSDWFNKLSLIDGRTLIEYLHTGREVKLL